MVTNAEEAVGKIGLGCLEVQITTYKISNKDILYSTGHIANIYNFKWSVIYKNTELLCCISETNKSNILQ